MRDITAQVDRIIQASPAAIWRALTTPALLKSFFFDAEVESRFEVGALITMTGEHRGRRYQDRGEILEVKPERSLVFSHWSGLSGAPATPENHHVVDFALEPREDGSTKVTLSQSNLTGGARPSDLAHRADYERNWAMVLEGLAKTVET